MLKYILFSMLLTVTGRSYSQDSLKKNIILPMVKEFFVNNHKVTFYKTLPKCLRHYLDQKNGRKIRISKRRFNATDIGSGPRRRLSFIVKWKDDYIISYEHGGRGYHCHSIIFETNGKEITGFYNVTFFDKQNNVTEFMEMLEDPRRYRVITYNEL
jgi:hypothetical protein